MNGMPRLRVISLIWPAVSSAMASDSITHGPAMRKNGRSSPASKPQSFMKRSQKCFASARTNRLPFLLPKPAPASDIFEIASCGGGLRARNRLGMARPGGLHIAGEQRMTVTRRGGEFRMELHAHEPGVIRPFDDFDQRAVHGCAGNHQALLRQTVAILVVEFVAVAVTLDDGILAVQTAHMRPRHQLAFLATQTHGAAEIAAD